MGIRYCRLCKYFNAPNNLEILPVKMLCGSVLSRIETNPYLDCKFQGKASTLREPRAVSYFGVYIGYEMTVGAFADGKEPSGFLAGSDIDTKVEHKELVKKFRRRSVARRDANETHFFRSFKRIEIRLLLSAVARRQLLSTMGNKIKTLLA